MTPFSLVVRILVTCILLIIFLFWIFWDSDKPQEEQSRWLPIAIALLALVATVSVFAAVWLY